MGKKEEITVEILRRAYGSAVQIAVGKKVKSGHIYFPKTGLQEAVHGVFEGVFLANYSFVQLKGESLKDNPSVLLEVVTVSGIDQKVEKQISEIEKTIATVHTVRDWVNHNADDINPTYFSEEALKISKF